MNYPALIACVVLLTAAILGTTWLAARLGRRGGATTPEPLDEYGDAALDRLPRAPSLPPPGYEEIEVPPPLPYRGLPLTERDIEYGRMVAERLRKKGGE